MTKGYPGLGATFFRGNIFMQNKAKIEFICKNLEKEAEKRTNERQKETSRFQYKRNSYDNGHTSVPFFSRLKKYLCRTYTSNLKYELKADLSSSFYIEKFLYCSLANFPIYRTMINNEQFLKLFFFSLLFQFSSFIAVWLFEAANFTTPRTYDIVSLSMRRRNFSIFLQHYSFLFDIEVGLM